MKKQELIEYIFKTDIVNKWHWFSYHFEQYENGRETIFAKSIVESCIECEKYIQGFAKDMIDNLSYLSGKEKYKHHYEQLLQRLAEILVIRQIVSYDIEWKDKFLYEPKSKSSKKNPELVINFADKRIGIEVKSPSLLKHMMERTSSEYQLTERSEISKDLISKSDVVFPRDNVIKEFLISANDKYEGFKREDDNFYGLLVIVWDDYIYEPITSLLSSASGLFTKQSFAKDADGNILGFNNVDGVILIRHMHQFVEAAAERPLIDNCKHALDYGNLNEFPFKAFIQNPNGKKVPNEILECLQADVPDETWGAEYMVQNIVMWVNSSRKPD